LAEAVSGTIQTTSFNVADTVRRDETRHISRIADLRREMESVLVKVEPKELKKVEKELELARAEFRGFITKLRAEYPEYAAIKYPIPMGADEIPLREDEVLISYYVTESGVLWYLLKGRKLSKAGFIDVPRKILARKIRGYRKPLATANLYAFDNRLSKQLYELLLDEILWGVEKKTKIVLVADGLLGLLSFETLVVEQQPVKFLSDVYDRISYAHSGTSLGLLRTLGGMRVSTKDLLVVADPIFGPDDARLNVVSKSQTDEADLKMMSAIASEASPDGSMSFPRLAETETLAQELVETFKGKSTKLSGSDASWDRLRKIGMQDYKYIVFATHGILDKNVPYIDEPALVLSQVGASPGFWTITDVMNSRLNADIVALVACSTGVGRILSGEGVMHIGRAFQYAGANTVLVSLWNVGEKPSVELTAAFFKNIKAGYGVPVALNRARTYLRSIHGRRYDHPFFWGAFIVIGD
jgi:hypothetical protein